MIIDHPTEERIVYLIDELDFDPEVAQIFGQVSAVDWQKLGADFATSKDELIRLGGEILQRKPVGISQTHSVGNDRRCLDTTNARYHLLNSDMLCFKACSKFKDLKWQKLQPIATKKGEILKFPAATS